MPFIYRQHRDQAWFVSAPTPASDLDSSHFIGSSRFSTAFFQATFYIVYGCLSLYLTNASCYLCMFGVLVLSGA